MTDAQPMFTAAELADRLGGRLVGEGSIAITGVDALEDARAGDVTFIAEARYAHKWTESRAAVAIVTEGIDVADPACVDKTFPTYWQVLDTLR